MSRRPVLTYERACEVLVYDPETGALNWRVGSPRRPERGVGWNSFQPRLHPSRS